MEPYEDVEVKIEDEMGIFVKEEESFIGVASTSAYGDDESINVADLLMEPRPHNAAPEFQKELLVYTTKLDEMHVWKNLHKYRNLKAILENIIRESKPVFSGSYTKKKKRKYMVKFNKFLLDLQLYKEKIAYGNNSSVSQVINKKHKHLMETINIDDDDESDDNSDDDNDVDNDYDVISAYDDTSKITSYSEVPNISSIAKDHLTLAKESINTNQNYNLQNIVVLICKLKTCDVYFVNSSGMPTGFYRIDEENLKIIRIHVSTRRILNHCCWFQRDIRLKQMKLIDYSSTLCAFIRRPHDCDVGNCVCCCKRKYNYECQLTTHDINQRTAKSNITSRWNQRLTSRFAQQVQNSWINAALVHRPKIKSLNKDENKRQCFKKLCLKLQCNNNLTHSYYLGNNGLITTYIRPNYLCTLQYYKDVIGSWVTSVPTEKICCLTEYKKYCVKLIKRAHPTVINFLSNNFVIEPNKCDACENREIKNVVGTKQFVVPFLPKYLRHTKPKHTIHTIVDRENNKIPYRISNNVIDQAINKSLTSCLTTTSTSQNLCAENNTKTHKASHVKKNIAPNSIDLGIGDLRLVIFPGGKVKILSRTSPDEISTESLKILREIIQHAQNKVLSQKFNPIRSINVNNLFTKDLPTPKNQENKPEAKTAASDLLSTEIVQNQSLSNSRCISNKNEQDKLINSNTQPSTKGQVIMLKPDSNLIRRDKNCYQVLKEISAEKRRQYLISHEFLKYAFINLWANVKVFGNEKLSENVIHNVHSSKETTKRKTADKGTSPPPKQIRKQISKIPISVTPVTSSSDTLLRTILESQTKTFTPNLPNSHSLQAVPIELLRQLQVPSASFSIPENVTVIPIGQLPQELVTSLYEKYATLPENTQPLNVQTQVLNPISLTNLLPGTSLNNNSHPIPFMAISNGVIIPSDVQRLPVIQNTQAVNIVDDDTDAKDEDCILGV